MNRLNRKKRNLKSVLSKTYQKYGILSTSRKLFIYYCAITFIGAFLLMIPISLKNNSSLSFINALFTSASAFSDTGLTTTTTVMTFNFFGQLVIATLILVGGIGWFAIRVYFLYWIFNRRLPLKMRMVLQTERGESKIGQTKEVIIAGVTAVLITIIIATGLLTLHFYKVNNAFLSPSVSPYHNFGRSIWMAFFHSVSAANNAGFDIVGSNSLLPYYKDYFVQVIFIILLVFGGVGFPIFFDIKQKIKMRLKGKNYDISLLTKLSLITYFIIFFIGLFFAFLFEIKAPIRVQAPNGDYIFSFWHKHNIKINGTDQTYSLGNHVMAIVFSVFSTRSAGFATLNMGTFTDPTKFLFSMLMFIGASPSSTGGGIRTTTFALSILGISKMLTRNTQVQIFKRKIPDNTLINAYAVTIIALILTVGVSLLVMTNALFPLDGADSLTNNMNVRDYHFTDALFTVASAFGTVGLASFQLATISWISKLALILLMFIGQLGISSTLFLWSKKRNDETHFSYIEEDVSIG